MTYFAVRARTLVALSWTNMMTINWPLINIMIGGNFYKLTPRRRDCEKMKKFVLWSALFRVSCSNYGLYWNLSELSEYYTSSWIINMIRRYLFLIADTLGNEKIRSNCYYDRDFNLSAAANDTMEQWRSLLQLGRGSYQVLIAKNNCNLLSKIFKYFFREFFL